MRTGFLLQLIAAAILTFGSAATLQAAAKASVTETPQGDGTTEYTVNNDASNTFDIAIILSTTTGGSPTTTNANWTAEALNANLWDAPMGFPAISEPTNPTWAAYTGLSYTQAYPTGPIGLNGYFLDYTFNSGADTISFPGQPLIPGASLGGFFFPGQPGSTFLVVGPTDGTTTFTPGDPTVVMNFSGDSTDLPEPASLGLATFAVCGLALRRRRREPFDHPLA